MNVALSADKHTSVVSTFLSKLKWSCLWSSFARSFVRSTTSKRLLLSVWPKTTLVVLCPIKAPPWPVALKDCDYWEGTWLAWILNLDWQMSDYKGRRLSAFRGGSPFWSPLRVRSWPASFYPLLLSTESCELWTHLISIIFVLVIVGCMCPLRSRVLCDLGDYYPCQRAWPGEVVSTSVFEVEVWWFSPRPGQFSLWYISITWLLQRWRVYECLAADVAKGR